MIGSAHPGFGLLEKVGLVLLAAQIAIVASMIVQNGLDGAENGFLMVVMATGLVIAANRRLVRDGDRNIAGWFAAARAVALAVLAIPTLVIALNQYLPSTVPEIALRAVFSMLWVIIALKGAVIGKLNPQGAIGLRVFWTLRSRLAWERAHRLLGRILFWGGLGGLAISLIVSPFISIGLWFTTIAGAVVVALLESWRIWRVDPERTRRSAA